MIYYFAGVILNNKNLIYFKKLFQKSVDYLFLCLFFVKSEGHKLYKLFTCDLADSRLVNKRCLGIVCNDFRYCNDGRVVHYDRIALGVSRASAVTNYVGYKELPRLVLRYRTGNNVRSAVVTLKIDYKFGFCKL